MTFASDIADVLAELGGDATIARSTGGTRDPVSRRVIGASTSTIPAKAVQDKRRAVNAQGAVSYETVLYSATEPLVDDVWAFGSKSFRVTAVELVAPAGSPILFIASVQA